MRKALFLVLLLAAWAVMSSAASAGVVTNLMTAVIPEDSTPDDEFQDQSAGYVLDLNGGGPNSGDIGWGLIRVETINTRSTMVGSNSFVYIVYSAMLGDIVRPDQALPYIDHSAVPQSETWSLRDILGNTTNAPDISDGAIAALVETKTAVGFTGVNFDALDIEARNTNSPSALRTAIQSVFTNPATSGTVLATFGIADPQVDFYRLAGFSSPFTQVSGLSVINSFVGPVENWGLLYYDPWANPSVHEIAIDQGQLSLSPTVHVDNGLSYQKTRDNGTFVANYVPEPSSMMALVGLGLAGSALALVRRRARKS